MALFSKRDGAGKGGKGKRSAANTLELVYESEASNRALAIGVRWKRVASSGGRADAWRLAREAGATHAVFQGQQLGMGLMPADVDKGTRVYPAALIAARHLGGNNVVALRIDEGFYWICETHAGQPTDIDEVLHNAEEADVLARVRELLDRNAALGGPVGLHTNIDDPGLETRSLELTDLFGSVLTDADQINPLPRVGTSLPKPVLYAAAVAILVLVAQQGYKKYDMWSRAKALAAMKAAPVDPTEAWNEAIANWERSVAAPDAQGLLAVRAELDKLPVEWDGWRLERADCNAVAPQGATRTWGCTARYKREAAAATNLQMAGNIPAGWIVTWLPLGGLQLSWNVVQPSQPISIGSLKKPEFFNIDVASRLQNLAPAMENEIAFAFAPVAIPAPKQNDGTAIPPDPRVEGLQSAGLLIKAPLRSVDALIAAGIEADYRSLSLSYAPGLSGKIKTSALTAEVKGDLYAKR